MKPHDLQAPGYTAYAILDVVGGRFAFGMRPSKQIPRETPRNCYLRLPADVDASLVVKWITSNEEVNWLVMRCFDGYLASENVFTEDGKDAVKSLNQMMAEAPTTS